MSIAYLFAGQGQQFLHMGQDLAQEYPQVKDIYDRASGLLGYDILNLSEEDLNNTVYTQPAIMTLNYAISSLLDFDVSHVAGLSLGEYSALVYAGVLSFEEALLLVSKRAEIMASALEDTGMMALLRTDIESVEEAIKDLNIAICNHNTPSQVVVGGYLSDLEHAKEVLKERGIKRIVPLSVSSVSHMYLMEDAANEFKEILNTIDFNRPQIKFINNYQAQIQNDNFVESLSKQISHKTRLSESIELMLKEGVDTFIEIGPKGSLKSCVSAHSKDVKAISIYDLITLKEGLINVT